MDIAVHHLKAVDVTQTANTHTIWLRYSCPTLDACSFGQFLATHSSCRQQAAANCMCMLLLAPLLLWGTLQAACRSTALLTLCLALLIYLQVPVQQGLCEDVQVGWLGLAIIDVCGKVANDAACCKADHHQGDARDCVQRYRRVVGTYWSQTE